MYKSKKCDMLGFCTCFVTTFGKHILITKKPKVKNLTKLSLLKFVKSIGGPSSWGLYAELAIPYIAINTINGCVCVVHASGTIAIANYPDSWLILLISLIGFSALPAVYSSLFPSINYYISVTVDLPQQTHSS